MPVQQVGGFWDFATPLFSTVLQIGGAVGTAALLNQFGPSQPAQGQNPQQPQLNQSYNPQWINGIDNSVVIISAIGLLVFTVVVTRNKK